MARSSAAIAAILGLGAGAGLFVLSAPKSDPGASDAALGQLAREVDGLVRETAAAVRSRANTISDLPRLAATVATDAVTARDLTKDELAFRVKDGETIVLGQVFKDGHTETLLRIPDDMTLVPPLSKPGEHLMVDGGKLVVAEVVGITPLERGEELTGALSVAQRVDLTPLAASLEALGRPAQIVLDGKPVLASKKPLAAGAETREQKPSSALASRLTVVAEVGEAPARSMGLVVGAVFAVLAGLGAAVVLARRVDPTTRRTSASVPPVVAPPPPAEDLGSARTEYSSGDVSPIEAGGKRTGTPRPALRPSTGPSIGQFGRYALIKQVGVGGMAEVYLARALGEAGFERQVALKIMHTNLARDEKVVDLFLDEARLVSRLDHPNIVQITDLGREGADYFIAMEFIDGWDLDRLLRVARERGQPVPLRVGLTIIRRICDGLHAAHTAKDSEGRPLELVHRDVKAENVLISRAGVIKVVDFGIAKANQQVHKTQMGELKGTAAYMAPEHRTGQAVDRRADLYGVGAIAYEVLTGVEVNLDLAMLAHLGRQGWPHLKPPSALRPDLPPELDGIVFKSLAYEKEDRFDSCEALEAAFDEVANRHNQQGNDKLVAQWVTSIMAGAPTSADPGAGTGAAGASGAA